MEKDVLFQKRITARLMPDYYCEFQCIAERCQDTCCVDWNIALSKNDYMSFRKLKFQTDQQALTRRVRGKNASDQKYAQFNMCNNSCPLLKENGLCLLQIEHGEQALPEVCRTFPRLTNHTPAGTWEAACSIGCEEVLRLLYQRREGLGFILEDIPKPEQLLENFKKHGQVAQHFSAIREFCIDILQDRDMPLYQRILLLGWVLRDLERRETENDPMPLGEWLYNKRTLAQAPELRQQIASMPGNKPLFVINNIKQMLLYPKPSTKLKQLMEDMLHLLRFQKTQQTGLEIDLQFYYEAEAEFAEGYGNLEYFFENILVNTFFLKKYPLSKEIADIWREYVAFCNVYGTLRFMGICGCFGFKGDLSRLFHVLTVTARELLHNANLQKMLTNEMMKLHSDSLTDMAILVRG